MRTILFIIPNPPYYRGGVETVCRQIIRNLCSEFEIEIYTTSRKIKTPVSTEWEGISMNIFPIIIGHFFSPSLIRYLKRNSKKYDLIHVHNYSTLLPLQTIICTDKNVPIVLNSHFHEKGSNSINKILRLFFDQTIGKIVVKSIKYSIFVSKTEKKHFLKKFGIFKKQKSKIIYNGVAIEEFRERKPLFTENIIILFVGRLEKYKNIHYVIESLQYLPKEYLFVILGKGPFKYQLMKKAEEINVTNRIRILTSLGNFQVQTWFKTASIVINLSEIESFGLTVIESLAAGKSCIVNPKTESFQEINQLFPGNLSFFSPKEENTLKLAQLIIQGAKKDSRDLNLDEFSWDVIASCYADFYHQIINNTKNK